MNSDKKKKICIIPARGGSKRIPRKNIKNFLGQPIISYSIKAALKSGLFEEVMVSTDDSEIAEISRSFGAEVPFYRSKENSNDYATTMEVIVEVMENYEKLSRDFDFCCCLYPTAPLINENDLLSAYEELIRGNFHALFTVQRLSFPIKRVLTVSDGKLEMLFPEHLKSRSQDLEPAFRDAGQFYWFNCSLNNFENVWLKNTGYVEIDELKAQDIDNESDWKMAELKKQLLYA